MNLGDILLLFGLLLKGMFMQMYKKESLCFSRIKILRRVLRVGWGVLGLHTSMFLLKYKRFLEPPERFFHDKR